MKILVNASTLAKGGGVQVGDAFIRELRMHPEHQYMVVCSPQVAVSLGDVSGFPSFIQFRTIRPLTTKDKLLRLFRINRFLDKMVRDFSADAVFTVFGPSYWRPNVPHLCGFAQGYHLYLDSPFYKNLSFAKQIRFFSLRHFHLFSFRCDSDNFVIESEDGAKRLKEIFHNKRIEVVNNNYNPIFDTPEVWKEKKLPDFDGVTLLTISAAYPHKNLQIIKPVAEYLIRRYPEFKFRFVATLEPEFFGYSKDNVPEWLLPIGRVGINECPTLYKQCSIMFLPSLMETFSANYPEAMRMGIPIATSDLSFAHGLCGDAAAYFDPLSPEDIGETIYSLANDSQYRNALVSAGKKRLKHFMNNSERASRYLSILEDISGKR